MKGLSLWQPHASLVAWGEKVIETRGYSVSYRGWLAIYATKAFPEDAVALCFEEPFRTALMAHGIRVPADLPRGEIVAVANLHRVGRIGRRRDNNVYVEGHDLPTTVNELAFGNYEPGRFGWCLTNVQALSSPIPCRGYQRLWDVPADVRARIELQVALPASPAHDAASQARQEAV